MVTWWVSEDVFVVILCVSVIYCIHYLSIWLSIYLRRSLGLELEETEDGDPDSSVVLTCLT